MHNKYYQPKDRILGKGEGVKGGWEGGREGGEATYSGEDKGGFEWGVRLPTLYLLPSSSYYNDDEISTETLNILISIHSFYIIQYYIEWQTHRVAIMG